MNSFVYGVIVEWKSDFRKKSILLTYYLVPLIFFAFMGGILSSINPYSKESLIQTMIIFCISLGAYLGLPTPLVEFYSSDIKRTYMVSNIPLWTVAANNFISACIHLSISCSLIIIISPFAFKSTLPENLVNFTIGYLLLLISSVSIGTLLGVYVKTISRITILGQLIFLPSIMLSGIMFPLNLLPDAFRQLGLLLPATQGFIIMNSSTLTAFPIFYTLLITGICLVITYIKLNSIKEV